MTLPDVLVDPALRRDLVRFVRVRAPESEVDDIVQSTLTEALASEHAPAEPDDIRRWVFGIARHKVVDYFRQAGREHPADSAGDDSALAESAPLSARDLLRWAERELPEGDQSHRTLDWMMREASGDKLESIAAEHRVPAARVRQRVWRLRQHFRERWALAVAVAVVLAAGGGSIWLLRPKPVPIDIAREVPSVVPTPAQRGSELRGLALKDCARGEPQRCLDRLDEARRLDPAGDTAPAVQEARSRAAGALRPAPSVTAVPSSNQAPTPPRARSKSEEAPMPKKAPTMPQQIQKSKKTNFSDFDTGK